VSVLKYFQGLMQVCVYGKLDKFECSIRDCLAI
jgi:hypothetical protein